MDSSKEQFNPYQAPQAELIEGEEILDIQNGFSEKIGRMLTYTQVINSLFAVLVCIGALNPMAYQSNPFILIAAITFISNLGSIPLRHYISKPILIHDFIIPDDPHVSKGAEMIQGSHNLNVMESTRYYFYGLQVSDMLAAIAVLFSTATEEIPGTWCLYPAGASLISTFATTIWFRTKKTDELDMSSHQYQTATLNPPLPLKVAQHSAGDSKHDDEDHEEGGGVIV